MLQPDSQGIRTFFTQLLAQGYRRGEIARDVEIDATVLPNPSTMSPPDPGITARTLR